MTDNGELIAAPGSLASTKSHLSSEFELLGRCGDWTYPAAQTGNPMLGVQVKTMLKGYGNHATQLGYQKRGALPLTEAEACFAAAQQLSHQPRVAVNMKETLKIPHL